MGYDVIVTFVLLHLGCFFFNRLNFSKDVALLSLIVIVLQSSSFVSAWFCFVLRCWLLLSLLFVEPIREPLLAATGRPLNFLFKIHKSCVILQVVS